MNVIDEKFEEIRQHRMEIGTLQREIAELRAEGTPNIPKKFKTEWDRLSKDKPYKFKVNDNLTVRGHYRWEEDMHSSFTTNIEVSPEVKKDLFIEPAWLIDVINEEKLDKAITSSKFYKDDVARIKKFCDEIEAWEKLKGLEDEYVISNLNEG